MAARIAALRTINYVQPDERDRFACHESGPGIPVAPGAGARAPYPIESGLLHADRIALSLRGALERVTIPLACAALAFVRAETWCEFGFARLDDYTRERLGRCGRWLRDLAALGERLPALPGLAAALTGADGGRPLGRVASGLIAKVATPASLTEWIEAARALPVRELRARVRAARGEEAGDSATPACPTPRDDTAAAASQPTAATSRDADDETDRVLLRIMVPAPILAAFDEALDLFRVVEGSETSVTAFIESLVAEALARGTDAEPGAPDGLHELSDVDRRALRTGTGIGVVERALASSTARWSHLPAHAESGWALALAGVTLSRFRALAKEAGRGAPVDLDRQLRSLVDIENEIEARLGRLLAELGDQRAWPRLRFAGVAHYGEERLGLSRTTAEDRARLARELRRLPLVRDAYESGRVDFEAAAIVARILRDSGPDPDLESAWVERAAAATIKRMRDEARALGRYRARGWGAASAANAEGEPAAHGDRPAPGRMAPLDDAEWQSSLHREPGFARRRIEMFARLTLSSPDVFQALPVEPDTCLRLRLPPNLSDTLLASVESERRRLAVAAGSMAWDEQDPGGPNPGGNATLSWLLARTFSIRCRRVPSWVGLLALLEDFVATWDVDERSSGRRGDQVYSREGWRCAAPGCTSRRNLEDHHLVYRSRGGGGELGNRLCACRFHHQRGEHGGLASCRGTAPLDVVWRLGRSGMAGWYRNEIRLAEKSALDAWRALGGTL